MRRRLQQASDDLLQSRAELEDKVLERTHQLAEKSEALSDQLLFIEVLLDALPSPVFYKGPTAAFWLQPGLRTGLRHHARLSAWQDGTGVALSAPADRVAYHEEDLHHCRGLHLPQGNAIPFADGRNHDTLYCRGFRLAMASRAVSSASS
jgi:two-component system sensor histidine kinase/response regulator